MDWDEEEEEEEEETVSATVEARAVVAGWKWPCARQGRGAAPGRLAGLCPRARGAESAAHTLRATRTF